MMHPMTNEALQHHAQPSRLTYQQAQAMGVRVRDWRGQDWVKHHRGLATNLCEIERLETLARGETYTYVDADRLAADLEYMYGAGEGAVLSHISAWRFHGLPLPELMTFDDKTYISIPRDFPRVRRSTVKCIRRSHEPVHWERGGVLVTHPAQTWLDLAKLTNSVEYLVMCGDHYILQDARRLKELERAVDRVKGVAGISRARQALKYIRYGAESMQESRMRYRMVKARLPEPVLQHEVRDEKGRFVARLDACYVEKRVAVEYQGSHHYTSTSQVKSDESRMRRLQLLGWKVLTVNSTDLADPMSAWIDDIKKVL